MNSWSTSGATVRTSCLSEDYLYRSSLLDDGSPLARTLGAGNSQLPSDPSPPRKAFAFGGAPEATILNFRSWWVETFSMPYLKSQVSFNSQ